MPFCIVAVIEHSTIVFKRSARCVDRFGTLRNRCSDTIDLLCRRICRLTGFRDFLSKCVLLFRVCPYLLACVPHGKTQSRKRSDHKTGSDCRTSEETGEQIRHAARRFSRRRQLAELFCRFSDFDYCFSTNINGLSECHRNGPDCRRRHRPVRNVLLFCVTERIECRGRFRDLIKSSFDCRSKFCKKGLTCFDAGIFDPVDRLVELRLSGVGNFLKRCLRGSCRTRHGFQSFRELFAAVCRNVHCRTTCTDISEHVIQLNARLFRTFNDVAENVRERHARLHTLFE